MEEFYKAKGLSLSNRLHLKTKYIFGIIKSLSSYSLTKLLIGRRGLVIFKIFKLHKRLLVLAVSVLLTAIVVGATSLKTSMTKREEVLYPDMVVEEVKKKPMPKKTIYLTFDDGPSQNTQAILDVLKKHDVKATFFVIGKQEDEYKQLVRQIYDDGHTVAPHSFSHIYHKIYASKKDYLDDFHKIYQYVFEITGEYPSIFRFPGGSLNKAVPEEGIMKKLIKEMTNRGFTYFDWNVVSGDDTSTVYPPGQLFKNVDEGIKKNSSAVVLFHDVPLSTTTPEAVDLVIEKYKKEGYNFAKLDAQTKPIHF